MRRREKIVNLADRAAVMEALKQLYGGAKDGNCKKTPSDGEPGTESPCEMDKNAESL